MSVCIGLKHTANPSQNILRQSLYYNYDYYHTRGQGAFAHNDYIARRDVCKCANRLGPLRTMKLMNLISASTLP